MFANTRSTYFASLILLSIYCDAVWILPCLGL